MLRFVPSIVALSVLCAPTLHAQQTDPSSPQTERLRVTNMCGYEIWVEQDFIHTVPGAPIVVKLPDGKSYDYPIPDAGIAATRFWAKNSCNEHGYNCGVGESSGVPEAQDKGWQTKQTVYDAPIDSKFEGTFGCTITGGTGCATNPSNGEPLDSSTYWDASAVDGYTFPFQINVKNDASGSCMTQSDTPKLVKEITCGSLEPENYCGSNDLSTNGKYDTVNGVDVTSVMMKYTAYMDDTKVVGCFSPCTKMTSGSWNGWMDKLGGLQPASPESQMYCCPTPPVSSAACRAGPADTMQYTKDVHEVCDSYAYAYDDGIGLVKCDGTVRYEMVFCPGGAATAPPQTAQRPASQAFCNSTVPGQMCRGDIPCPSTVAACGANPEMCRCPSNG
ncbi:MAG: hypothetical protein QNJ44_18015 [Rhodobacter sp.]|nr:hypothetical protein [Rhodobacter sp.]